MGKHFFEKKRQKKKSKYYSDTKKYKKIKHNINMIYLIKRILEIVRSYREKEILKIKKRRSKKCMNI